MRVKPLVSALESLRDAFDKIKDTRRFSDVWVPSGGPPLAAVDLFNMTETVLGKLLSVDWESAPEKDVLFLNSHVEDINVCVSTIVPQLYGHQMAAFSVLGLLSSLESAVSSSIGLSEVKGTVALPFSLHRRVKHALDRLSQSSQLIDDIDRKLKQIQSAYDAAENLPATQKDLEDAVKDVEAAFREIEKIKKAALTNEVASKVSADEAQARKDDLDRLIHQAHGVLGKVNEAYRAATSQGLAHAFSKRQTSLNLETWYWVALLGASLIAAGVIGHLRFPDILHALSGNLNWGVVSINMLISALSLAPAVWFAWMATKQIGQRFRLAEDYGYKAALAMAYEGYRSEAARLDPLFEAQLFATALGRLDELPLRLIESDAPGSPMHELFKTKEFKSASDLIPGFKDRVGEFLKRTASAKPSSQGQPPAVPVSQVTSELAKE